MAVRYVIVPPSLYLIILVAPLVLCQSQLPEGTPSNGSEEIETDPNKDVETVTTAEKEETTTTEETDYEEDEEDECDEGGIEIFNKIVCIFKIIAGLLFGNSDPCCPLELPSFG